jgi:hypothetical protein
MTDDRCLILLEEKLEDGRTKKEVLTLLQMKF